MRKLALCPNCMKEVSGVTIVREKINNGETAIIETGKITLGSPHVHTTMYSCPNCHVILGIAQHVSYVPFFSKENEEEITYPVDMLSTTRK